MTRERRDGGGRDPRSVGLFIQTKKYARAYSHFVATPPSRSASAPPKPLSFGSASELALLRGVRRGRRRPRRGPGAPGRPPHFVVVAKPLPPVPVPSILPPAFVPAASFARGRAVPLTPAVAILVPPVSAGPPVAVVVPAVPAVAPAPVAIAAAAA